MTTLEELPKKWPSCSPFEGAQAASQVLVGVRGSDGGSELRAAGASVAAKRRRGRSLKCRERDSESLAEQKALFSLGSAVLIFESGIVRTPAISGVNDETERSAANFEQRGSATLTPGNLGGRAVRACAPRAKLLLFPREYNNDPPGARNLRENEREMQSTREEEKRSPVRSRCLLMQKEQDKGASVLVNDCY